MNIPLKASLLLGSLLLLSTPSLAHADEPAAAPPRFGDAGQIALHLNDGITSSLADVVTGPQVQVDYFVVDHLSLGVMAGVDWYHESAVNSEPGHSLIVRVGPRIGYDIPLSPYVSFWPQIGVDFRSDTETEFSSSASSTGASSSSASSQTTTAFAFVAVAPLLIHPTRGFFIGAGPAFYTEFSNSTGGNDNPKQTSLGLMATLGGAF